jgi:hypothetical protein
MDRPDQNGTIEEAEEVKRPPRRSVSVDRLIAEGGDMIDEAEPARIERK